MRLVLMLVAALSAAGCASTQVVTVSSNPPGAELSVDGKFVGRTPATFTDEPTGGHYYKLQFKAPGYAPTEKVIKQEQSKGSVACIGVAAGCCPLMQVCLLKSYHLPQTAYTFDLNPEGGGGVMPAPYPQPPPNEAPPPPQSAPPPPGSYPAPPPSTR